MVGSNGEGLTGITLINFVWMEKPTEKHCPRCNKAFVCNAGDIVNCQCYSVALNQAARNFFKRGIRLLVQGLFGGYKFIIRIG